MLEYEKAFMLAKEYLVPKNAKIFELQVQIRTKC